MNNSAHDRWWLATLGRTLIWARLRELDAGTAEVFDSDGATLPFDSVDTARAALMDAAKLNGLVVDTTEKISRSPEERAARLAALKAERERLASIH